MSSGASALVTLVSPQLVPTFAVRTPEQIRKDPAAGACFKLRITICNGKGESGKITRKAWTTSADGKLTFLYGNLKLHDI
jgi:hypothetical protein